MGGVGLLFKHHHREFIASASQTQIVPCQIGLSRWRRGGSCTKVGRERSLVVGMRLVCPGVSATAGFVLLNLSSINSFLVCTLRCKNLCRHCRQAGFKSIPMESVTHVCPNRYQSQSHPCVCHTAGRCASQTSYRTTDHGVDQCAYRLLPLCLLHTPQLFQCATNWEPRSAGRALQQIVA